MEILTELQSGKLLWLGGEMEIPTGITSTQAYAIANKIACSSGYLVSHRGGRLTISGGDIRGYYVLDWFDTERPGPVKVEHWTSEDTYLDPPPMSAHGKMVELAALGDPGEQGE